MTTYSPKSDSPEYYWFDAIAELQALVDPLDPRYIALQAMLTGSVDGYVLDVAAFAAAGPPDNSQPVIEDFLDGSWVTVLENLALYSVFYNLCQEDD